MDPQQTPPNTNEPAAEQPQPVQSPPTHDLPPDGLHTGLFDPAPPQLTGVPKKNKKLLILIIVIVLLVGGGAAAYVLTRDKKTPAANTTQPNTSQNSTTPSTPLNKALAAIDQQLGDKAYSPSHPFNYAFTVTDKVFTFDTKEPEVSKHYLLGTYKIEGELDDCKNFDAAFAESLTDAEDAFKEQGFTVKDAFFGSYQYNDCDNSKAVDNGDSFCSMTLNNSVSASDIDVSVQNSEPQGQLSIACISKDRHDKAVTLANQILQVNTESGNPPTRFMFNLGEDDYIKPSTVSGYQIAHLTYEAYYVNYYKKGDGKWQEVPKDANGDNTSCEALEKDPTIKQIFKGEACSGSTYLDSKVQ